MTGVEIRRTNVVDHRETGGHGPAGIDAQQTVRRNVIRVAGHEREPAPADPGAPPDSEASATSGLGASRMCRARRTVRMTSMPSIDVAADEELFGGATPKIDLPPAVGACRRLEIDVRGLRRSAGMGQRLRQSLLPLRRRPARAAPARGRCDRRTRPDRTRARRAALAAASAACRDAPSRSPAPLQCSKSASGSSAPRAVSVRTMRP